MDKFSYAIGLGIGQNLAGMGAKGISVELFGSRIKKSCFLSGTAIAKRAKAASKDASCNSDKFFRYNKDRDAK